MFFGRLEATQAFESTILHNVDPNSDYLWAHIVVGWLFFPIALLFMHLYSSNILSDYIIMKEKVCKTIALTNVPQEMRDFTRIKDWFKTKYPFIKLGRIFLSFNTAQLEELCNWKRTCELAIENSQIHTKLYKHRCSMLCCTGGRKHGNAAKYKA